MKTKLRLTFLLLSISISLFSQNIFDKKTKIVSFETTTEISKLSPATRNMLLEAKHNKLVAKNNNLNELGKVKLNNLVRITLLFEENCSNFNSANIFTNVSKISDNISTAFIKIENLPLLENLKCLKYADIGGELKLNDNNAINATNTNSVHLGTGLSQSYTGAGVVIGIIDKGFDYTHPNFKDINGNLRISRVWERTNNTGTPPSALGFTYGSEFKTPTDILNKLYDMTDESHGTHVAGIAAGTGTGDLSLLKGMAPNSEIVLVSGFKPTTAFDSISPNYTYIDAIKYIENYAAFVKKPVVINMSFGDSLGPHDGTTIQETAINNLTNDQGLVIVTAAGNNGGESKHALMNFSSENYKYLVLDNTIPLVNNTLTPENISHIDIWSQNTSLNGAFEIQIGVYNVISQVMESTTTIAGIVNGKASSTLDLIDVDTCSGCTNDNYTVILNSEINPLNNKIHLTIKTLNDNNDSWDRLVIGIKSSNNNIHAWSENCSFGSYPGLNFTGGDDFYTIGSPGSASGVITVGSYNVTDENLGNPQGVLNGLSYFSSKGPRTDLLIKPDVTAPGNRIISSINSYDPAFQSVGKYSSDVTNTFGNYKYAKMNGTSMAAPVVTGIVALWLQAFPQLTTNKVKGIISNTCPPDNQVSAPFSFYGTNYSTPPNVKWGFGKIDALAGMRLIEQTLSKVVISQICGGGGNSGAPYTNDYIELFNSGTVAQNLSGWSVQCTSATGPTTTWFPINLPDFTLQPGQYYLIQGAGGASGVALPTANVTSTASLGATAGKVILVSSTTAETAANPTGSQIIDKVAYGASTAIEGTPAGALSNTTAAIRNLGGCTDTDNNATDFSVGTPSPRNSSSAFNLCSSLSVSQNELETVTLFPNPTSSKVFFNNSIEKFETATVINYLGQVVTDIKFVSFEANQQIDLSSFTDGVYILKLKNQQFSKTVKIIKQ